jgi:arylsulfatase A-like enzyme
MAPLIIACAVPILSLLLGSSAYSAETARGPNIVLILADDLGYMDIGANNPQTFYETPHIDRLAKRGMRFTQGYSACCVCSPTRASIMTGKYPPRVGITDYIGANRPGKLLPAPNQNHLALEETTLAEALRDAGYATFMAGKWHLGRGEYSPNAYGFAPGLAEDPAGFYPDNEPPPPDIEQDPKRTDRIADDCVRFIDEPRSKPFFAYLPFNAVHVPIGARAELVEKYRRKAASVPSVAWGRERNLQVRLTQSDPVYAAMIEQFDAAIGRIVAAVERRGLTEKTVFVFTSDNGGVSTAQGKPTANAPLRAGKGWPYEGGVRVAWIIAAPGVTEPGSVCETPVMSTDFYPTMLELAWLPLAPRQHRDAVSLLPLLRGGELPRGALFWHYPHYGGQGGAPYGAIRDGDWKLIEWYEDGSLELFNLRDDVGETKNLASEEPEMAHRLHARLAAWRNDVGAIMPTPNPDYDPQAKPLQPRRKARQQ